MKTDFKLILTFVVAGVLVISCSKLPQSQLVTSNFIFAEKQLSYAFLKIDEAYAQETPSQKRNQRK